MTSELLLSEGALLLLHGLSKIGELVSSRTSKKVNKRQRSEDVLRMKVELSGSTFVTVP